MGGNVASSGLSIPKYLLVVLKLQNVFAFLQATSFVYSKLGPMMPPLALALPVQDNKFGTRQRTTLLLA